MPEHAALSPMEVKVKAHVREGRAVKGYEAERLKGIGEGGESQSAGKKEDVKVGGETVSTEGFQQEYDKVAGGIFDKDGQLRDDVPTDVLESHVKNLFTLSTKSGVDPLINSSSDFLSNVYDQQNKQTAGIDLATATPRDVMGNMLLDRENLETTIKSVDGLQSKFENDFGVKTKRIDPFTFSFNFESHLGTESQAVRDKVITHMQSKSKKMAQDYPEILNEESSGKINWGNIVDGLKDGMGEGERAQNSNIGPSVVAANIGEYNAPMVSLDTKLRVITMLRDNDIETFGFHNHKSDQVRDLMTKKLKEYSEGGNAKEINSLIDTFSKLDGGSVVPALSIFYNKGVDPKFILDHPNFIKDIRKVADGLKQNYMNSGVVRGDINVSRNPMNILTMSPDKGAPSCQSLIKEGELHIDSNNINVPASYNTQATNDFIMYTTSKEGGKNARMSLSYDPKYGDYASHEEMAVYGDSRAGKELLKQFTDKNGDYFTKSSEHDVTMGEVQKEIPVWKKLDGVRKGVTRAQDMFFHKLYSEGTPSAEKAFADIKSGHEQWQERKGEIVDAFLNGLNNMYYNVIDEQKSMLYGSKTHSLVSGSDSIVDEFKKLYKGVDRAYQDAHDTMSYTLAERKNSSKSA